jgi:glutamate synthase (NADPH/NADH) small chain
VLSINEPAVTIEHIEKSIIEHAFEEGWVVPQPPEQRTGKTVGIIGSGPAGLACAQQLNRAGHTVTVFERAPKIGGLLRYGIPDFKLEKWIIDRRLQIIEKEGVIFKSGVNVGKDVSIDELKKFDAVVLCGGATKPRDLPIPGRELDGIHFAMDFLTLQNNRVAGVMSASRSLKDITATGKRVIVIGGGDTGSDCIGTSNRQGAKSVTSFELLPMPPEGRPAGQPWPYWPMRLRTSSSHKENGQRFWSILTKKFVGAGDRLRSLITVNVEVVVVHGRPQFRDVPGTEHEWPTDLVLLALGFTGPEPDGIIAQLGVELDRFGNVKSGKNYMTNVPGIFSAGDMRRGQSLVVWAISEGREAARGVDSYLMGHSELPTKGDMDLPRV